VRREITDLLLATEDEIAWRVREALRGDVTYTSERLKRAVELLAIILVLRSDVWRKASTVFIDRMMEYILEEAEFLPRALRMIDPTITEVASTSNAMLREVVRTRPFEGRTLRDWVENMRYSDISHMKASIMLGLSRREDSESIARRLVGSAVMKGRDGAFQQSRNNSDAVTQTAVAFYSGLAREEFAAANPEIFSEELFVAILDGQTTALCRSLDHKIFPVSSGPMPPLHIRCRSSRVPLINGMPLPKRMSYEQWMRTQSVEFQNDTLGVTKARLFRTGKLSLSEFVNRSGDELTLAELAVKEAAAFRAAGLDPTKYAK
jgi:hypothetical protein